MGERYDFFASLSYSNLAIWKTKLLEIWPAYFHIFLVHGCKILQKSDNPCMRYNGFQFGLFFPFTVSMSDIPTPPNNIKLFTYANDIFFF